MFLIFSRVARDVSSPMQVQLFIRVEWNMVEPVQFANKLCTTLQFSLRTPKR